MSQEICRPNGNSYYESTARRRLLRLLDADSFREILGPAERVTSPHLQALEQPCAFDDGIVIGTGRLEGKTVFAASQEGGFMGGAVGEVHGAKLVGLLERAAREQPAGVLLLLESGGVRLHEANAGLIGVSEIIRALLAARAAGCSVLGLIGGQFGCFGGMGIVARCCDALVINEEGRLGLSGPDVIETTMGVEEFDASDRALVWRTVGGKHRYLLGEVNRLVEDDIGAFRRAAVALLGQREPLSLEALEQEQAALARRLQDYGSCPDALDIWRAAGVEQPKRLPLLDAATFLQTVRREVKHDAA